MNVMVAKVCLRLVNVNIHACSPGCLVGPDPLVGCFETQKTREAILTKFPYIIIYITYHIYLD
jgi:hypothetical protein